MFYGIRYSKVLQEVINTQRGKLARDMVNLSTTSLAGKIETFSQREGKWSSSSLSPQAAALTSVAMFGVALVCYGETADERLAGSTLKSALADYGTKNPEAEHTCTTLLTMWSKDTPWREG